MVYASERREAEKAEDIDMQRHDDEVEDEGHDNHSHDQGV